MKEQKQNFPELKDFTKKDLEYLLKTINDLETQDTRSTRLPLYAILQDGYVEGGRWSKRVLETKEGMVDECLKKEIVNLDKLHTKVFAILKDGEWVEQGEMGWFGVSSNNKTDEEWKNKVNEIISSLEEDEKLTVVDCHI